MKLLYCVHCGDIVRLFPEKRTCLCGKTWGYYLEDNATTEHNYPSLSIGIATPDFQQAAEAFFANPAYFSPIFAMRCWLNPVSERDVKFVIEKSPLSEEQQKALEQASDQEKSQETG